MKIYLVQEVDEYRVIKAFLSKDKAQALVDEENRKWFAHREKIEAWRQLEKEFFKSQDKSTLDMFTSELISLSNQFNTKHPFPVPEEEYINYCGPLSVGELEVQE